MTGIRHQDPIRRALNPARPHFFDTKTGTAV
jgi:hypothetical protein